MNKKIALIGGSGVYSIFKESQSQEKEVKTPFGVVSLAESKIDEKWVYFLPRHGSSHSIPPHMINFKANIYALAKINIDFVILMLSVA